MDGYCALSGMLEPSFEQSEASMRILIALVVLIASFGVQAQATANFTLESLEGVSYTLPAEQEGVGIYLF